MAGRGELARELVASLRTEQDLQVEGYDTALRAGRKVSLRYVTRSDRTAQQLGTLVSAVVGRQSSSWALRRSIVRP